jgi:large subunit ribosomal protein L18Ae
MAGRSRAKASAIQILKTAELTAEECKRPIVKQFHVRAARPRRPAEPCRSSLAPIPRHLAAAHAPRGRLPRGARARMLTPCPPPQSSTIKFPLPHRVIKAPKQFKSTFKASRPNTYY